MRGQDYRRQRMSSANLTSIKKKCFVPYNCWEKNHDWKITLFILHTPQFPINC